MNGIYQSSALTRNVEHTHSLQEFIALGKSVDIYDYLRFSMVESRGGTKVVIHNVLDDYVLEMKDQAILVHLSPKQVDEYRYNPKKLSWKMYGTTTLYHVILKLNNLASTHDFNLRSGKLLLFSPGVMEDVIASVYSSERYAIQTYNVAHSNDTSLQPVNNDRLTNLV